jgi:hypothetical protein
MNEVLFTVFLIALGVAAQNPTPPVQGSSPKRIAISASQNYRLADAGSGSRDPHLAAAINSKP